MKVNSINNSLNFGRVFAVAGSKEDMQKLDRELKTKQDKMISMPVTDLYVNRTGEGLCTQAAKSGDEIRFIITGKEDMHNVNFMVWGWGSANGISHHITDFIKLDNIKEAAKRIIKSTKE